MPKIPQNAWRTGVWTLAMGLAACGGETAPPTAGSPPAPPPAPAPSPPPSTTVTLSVVNGYGPATAAPSAQVELWSRVLPNNEIVTSWSGGTFAGDNEEWHATLTVPASNAMITANIQTLAINFDTQDYSAPTNVVKTARLHVPAAPRGLILILHGTGGNSTFIERAETRYLALKAVSKGYAVLSPEAEESQVGDLDGDAKLRWDARLSPANLDLQTLDRLLESLYASGRISPSVPLYALGMSNGGTMAVTLGAVGGSQVATAFPRLRFRAVISYCAQARDAAVLATQTPSAWYLCGNDDNAEVSNASAQGDSSALTARGIASDAFLHPATPLFDERFARVLGISVAQSRLIVQELRNAGFVDSANFISKPTSEIVAAASATPSQFPTVAGLTAAQQIGIRSQISVMRAEHEFFSDWSSRTIRWFQRFP